RPRIAGGIPRSGCDRLVGRLRAPAAHADRGLGGRHDARGCHAAGGTSSATVDPARSAGRHPARRRRAAVEDADRAGGGGARSRARADARTSPRGLRIAADAERLEAESEQQRAGLMRLRDELARAIQETISAGNAELEGYAAERRRALHELNERIRRRERSLAEQIEREETDATRRIQ